MKYKHIILTGYSNAGKNFIGDLILKQDHDVLKCVTGATRLPRPGEENGKDYFFFSKPTFLQKASEDWFIETNSYLEELGLPDFLYGTPRHFVEENRYKRPMLFNVDPKGAEALEKYFGDDCISVFLDVEDIEVLKQRASERKTNESDAELKARLDLVDIQSKKKNSFNYCLVNENGEEKAVKLAAKILTLASIGAVV